MERSLIIIAEQLNSWNRSGLALVVESETGIVVGELSSDRTHELARMVGAIGWSYRIQDEADSEYDVNSVGVHLEPLRILIDKPSRPSGVAQIVTIDGLIEWLMLKQPESRVWVACLAQPFETLSVRFSPWGDEAVFQALKDGADPRKVVRETGGVRKVVDDLGPWLLRDPDAVVWDDPVVVAWTQLSARVLMRTLASEIEPDSSLLFRGPPVRRVPDEGNPRLQLGRGGFSALQQAASWVHENEREQEIRHGLFVAEFARSAAPEESAGSTFKELATTALEGARIAYQLGLSQLSRDALKAMADLRKAVSDETSKLSDTTRQLTTASASALFGGIGLIAARLTVAFTSGLIAGAVVAVGIVLGLYVLATILNGWQFVRLQRHLRMQWRTRLYRFLTDDEYTAMVSDPAHNAERGFWWASWISGTLAVVLMIAVICSAFAPLAAPNSTLSGIQQNREQAEVLMLAPPSETSLGPLSPRRLPGPVLHPSNGAR